MLNKHQQGSTLFGVLVALTVLSTLLVYQADNMILEVRHIRAQQTVADGREILDAIRNYYADQEPIEANRWPADIAVLIKGKYLLGNSSFYGEKWGFTISSDQKTAELVLKTGNIKHKRWIAAQLIGGHIDGDEVHAQINRPGDEAIHSLLYDRDGTRNLTGTLDANKQGIEKAQSITYE